MWVVPGNTGHDTAYGERRLSFLPGKGIHASIPTPRRQKQVNLCELEASQLGLLNQFQASQDCIMRSCLKQFKKKKHPLDFKLERCQPWNLLRDGILLYSLF